ncbi:MAG: hypothetical protein D6785_12095 [Planctomycetota bacterium]|nr:MAG: hypothetical protein D6785_12095 [Planctomycetota bacterium]
MEIVKYLVKYGMSPLEAEHELEKWKGREEALAGLLAKMKNKLESINWPKKYLLAVLQKEFPQKKNTPQYTLCSDWLWLQLRKKFEDDGVYFCKYKQKIWGLKLKGEIVISVISNFDGKEFFLLESGEKLPVKENLDSLSVFLPSDSFLMSNPCEKENCCVLRQETGQI